MKRKRSCSPETRSTNHGSSGAEFDVFLSFRGSDTRDNFTDFLYYALRDKGIHVFIDKKGIHVGEEIGPEIYQAIDDSKICIPIFSKGYASSSWCLRELEHMMERKKAKELEVMPLFYDVEPSDVKLETEVYTNALTQHKGKHGAETVQRWAKALKEVTGIKGWDTKNTSLGELARLIALEVSVNLEVSCVHISDHLVGMDESVNRVINLLNVESRDVRLVGICGMGGIGKTTLAKVVYRKLSANFESCSFISNIREASNGSGLSNLQEQLISNILGDVGVKLSNIGHGINMIRDRFKRKKVLILLDDVDQISQLEALAGKAEWFGLRSRILVTTRDRSVLNGFQDQFGRCLIYEAKELNNPEALQLFSKHAFRSNSPPNTFSSLSKKVISKTGGLPLAIEVIGSFLCRKKEAVWEDTLKKMEYCPRKDVKEKLMLSYEALDHHQQQIFLDIACFLAGENKSYANYMWDDCGYCPHEGIEVLLSMSLVKITENNKLWMHDQLKDLGRSIVFQENCQDPGKRSRMWNHEEALDMIKRKKGTETVAAMNFRWEASSGHDVLTPEIVRKVPNIRFLQILGGTPSGDFEDHFSELRWLSWYWAYWPWPGLGAANFCPKNLVILDMSRSSIDEHWGGWTQLKVATRLKVLNLSWCCFLRTTPDLSAYLSLEILILERCEALLWIDPSIGHLRRLKHMNLNKCRQFKVLPVELGTLEALTELLLDCTGISQIPSSIGKLVNLECLSIREAYYQRTLPDSIGKLKCLAKLDISHTFILDKLPNTIVNLKSLKVLKMNYSGVRKLPEAIAMLEKLEEIHGERCLELENIPGDIVRLPFLKTLNLTTTLVKNVPKLPHSLVSLYLSSRALAKAPEISNLVSLRNLELCFPSTLSIFHYSPEIIFHYSPEISGPRCRLDLPSITSISSYLGCIFGLEELELSNCKNLCHIGQLPSSLRKLIVNNCNLCEAVDLSNLCNFKNLKDLKVWDCPKLVEIQGLTRLESLESLYIRRCSSWLRLPDLSNLKKLKEWDVDALTTYSARGKQVARSSDLPLWHWEKAYGINNS